MRAGVVASVGLIVCSSVACAGTATRTPGLPESPAPVSGRLLAFPHGDAEALLGREVRQEPTGGFRIADARAPGCDVVVRHKQAQYSSRRESSIEELASIGAGYQRLVALEAKYGRRTRASLDLENVEIVEGDPRGACKGTIITTVFVGRGKRRLFAATETEARARLPVAAVVEPSVRSNAEVLDELAWKDDQAYAFDVEAFGESIGDAPKLDIRFPSIVTEGDELQIVFESARDAYLVVLYVDADGKGDVLWPSNEEPLPKVPAGGRAVLPSQSERAANIHIRPMLAKPGVKAREQLFVYAFSDRRDFELAKPSAGTSSADGVAYAEALAKKLSHVPAQRWSRTTVGYTIEPRPGADAGDRRPR